MPTFWRRYYRLHAILLATSALGLLLLFHFTQLDLTLADRWYDAAQHFFPLREAWWAETALHGGLHYVLIALALVCVGIAWRQRKTVDALRWRFVAASGVAIPLLVAVGKRVSPMYCPWDINRYGGNAPYHDVLTALTTHVASFGHCFPAGFVSLGSWMLAFALMHYPQRRRFSVCIGLAVLAFNLGLGLLQQLRGAHFLSHVLWTLWLSWAVILLLHARFGLWRASNTATPAN